MNKYLLLRDNKQSGPYTCEELQAKGIKAYDLVWIEGKSAAWRYPSEVEELKPYAPVIEEQPFERFYKKPSESSTEIRSQKEEILQPVKSEPVSKKSEKPVPAGNPSTPKKVYINFPATASPKSNPVNEPEVTKEIEKPVTRQIPVAQSVQQVLSVDTPPARQLTVNSNGGSLSEPKNSGYERYPAAQKPAARPVLVVLAAACVLLIGVIIGLIYSYNSTAKKQKELETLLQQMKRSQEQPSSIQPKETPLTSADAGDNNVGTTNEPPIEGTDPLPQSVSAGILVNGEEEKKTPAIQKTKKVPIESNQKVKTEIASSHEPIAIPAILTEVEKPRTDLLEQNRKNIFQKVSVENNKFKVGVLGGINDLQLTLTNRSLFQLEQVEVEVKYLGAENKIVKTQTVYFTNVSPGEKLSLKVPKSNRGIAVDYSIKKINTKELGMASSGS